MSVQTLINKSKGRIGNVNPVVWKYGQDLIKQAYKQGLYVMFSDGHRTHAEQNALYAQGRTKAGQIVTNARGGQSLHNYGVALDMFITNKNGTSASWNAGKLRQAAQIAKKLGFEWGGDWTSFKDYPHIQMTGGLSLSQLQAGRKPNLTYKGSALSSNSGIKRLQQDLKKLGYKPGTIDGVDGKNTQEAVKAFQKAEGLKVDGIAGKDTKAEIKRILDGGLTMSEAKKINNRLDKIENLLGGKMDIPSNYNSNTPDPSHKGSVEQIIALDLSNGKNPHKYLTREQMATIIVKLYEHHIKMSDWMQEAIAEKFDVIAPHLKKPDEWLEKLKNGEAETPEILGMFMLAYLDSEEVDKPEGSS